LPPALTLFPSAPLVRPPPSAPARRGGTCASTRSTLPSLPSAPSPADLGVAVVDSSDKSDEFTTTGPRSAERSSPRAAAHPAARDRDRRVVGDHALVGRVVLRGVVHPQAPVPGVALGRDPVRGADHPDQLAQVRAVARPG